MTRPTARRGGGAALVACSLLAAALLGRTWLEQRQAASRAAAVERAGASVSRSVALGELGASERADVVEARDSLLDSVVVAARRRVGDGVAPWQRAGERALRDRFVALARRGAFAEASRLLALWEPADDDPVALEARIDTWIGTGALDEARAAAWAGAEHFEEARPAFMRRWYASFTADPAFWSRGPRTVRPGPSLTTIRHLDAGSSVLLLFQEGEHIWGVMKPAQTNPFSNYRGEVATYRLCPLIHCAVDVPRNEEVRISEADLVTLMGLSSPEELTGLRRYDYEPVWEDGADGERWLYGALEDWVPGFTSFPIEEIEAWRPLVDGSMSVSELRRTPLRVALAPLGERDPEWFAGFLARAEGVTAYELAHQLSDLHVLDALINNWDRYSSLDPGSNCHFDGGRLLSIDNGASFATREEWHGHGVTLRLRRIRRFSRQTIDAVRWMDTEALFEVLFPEDPRGEDDEARYQAFLARRRTVLEWVDELIARSGDERVLIFP